MEDGSCTKENGKCDEKVINGEFMKSADYYIEMRSSCKEAVDIAVNYLENVEKYKPFPTVKPGFLVPQIPSDPPKEGVTMQVIFKDVDRLLMPGVAHWNHPHFHAYFAMANSYPAVCADIIGSAIGGIGFTWASSPVNTELEYVMTNWLVKMLGLPNYYLHSPKGGGGVIGKVFGLIEPSQLTQPTNPHLKKIQAKLANASQHSRKRKQRFCTVDEFTFPQTTCSEQAIITMMAARNKAINKYMCANPGATKFEALSKLAHCSIERAGLLNLLPIRSLPVNDKFQLTGETLEAAILEDIAEGKIPFYCVATLGTTSVCSFDKLDEIGPVCKKFDVWLHVDAAYAGSAFICPENRHYLRGIEFTSSFAFNPHKWLLTNFDCSVVW
ncbi:hypothetical protein ACTXT7_000814 [Hymenolepis weldensis]